MHPERIFGSSFFFSFFFFLSSSIGYASCLAFSEEPLLKTGVSLVYGCTWTESGGGHSGFTVMFKPEPYFSVPIWAVWKGCSVLRRRSCCGVQWAMKGVLGAGGEKKMRVHIFFLSYFGGGLCAFSGRVESEAWLWHTALPVFIPSTCFWQLTILNLPKPLPLTPFSFSLALWLIFALPSSQLSFICSFLLSVYFSFSYLQSHLSFIL